MIPNEITVALKSRKMAEMRNELGFVATETDDELRVLRAGLIHGRLHELQELGVFAWQESHALASELKALLGENPSEANDHYFARKSAVIDWVSASESNTPRGEVTGLRIEPEMIAVRFRGGEAGYGSSWAGSIELKRTVAVQTIHGHYEITPDAKVAGASETVKYTVIGCFSDDTCTTFTGTWTEGPEYVYEFNVDIH
jgi:hypothetical protein